MIYDKWYNRLRMFIKSLQFIFHSLFITIFHKRTWATNFILVILLNNQLMTK